MFISELHVQGYKRLRDFKLPMGPLTVLIGPNAVGKTAVLEVLDLVGRSAERRLSQRVVELGGFTFVRSSGVAEQSVRLELTFGFEPDPGRSLVYSLLLGRREFGYEITSEALRVREDTEWVGSPEVLVSGDGRFYYDRGTGDLSEADFEWDAAETGLSQTPSDRTEAEAFRRQLSLGRSYRPIDASLRGAVRRPQGLTPIESLAVDGTNLVAALQQKRALDPSMFDALLDTLRAAYPDFERLEWPMVSAGEAVITWREQGRLIWANQLSEGTLRFLFLAAILLASTAPPLITIDEPEVSLHPDLLRILADLLVDASRRTQLLVATQSAELVGFLKPEHVAVMEMDDDGWAKVTPASDMDLGKWLEDYTLGQLWTKGVLGGLP